jgi:dTDP-4-dehydrorhamnose reductase
MRHRVEIWAGVEGTINRVGDQYFDQCRRSGHEQRDEDVARLAALGIDALRYPVLWERVERDGWGWSDRRLALLREHGVRPIVGLLHHGSGPARTSLVDPGFPEAFAAYAAACAARYPWVRDWTPVNEPLTTARFSGLYGVWYPHGHDDATFIRALLGQCRATILAMERIRAVNPEARLIQTEDLGRTSSTPELAYQAELENHRRWLSLDLLCGRVDAGHPLREYLAAAGASDADLAWFVEHPCPPDVLGINHYLTSERWLDHRLDRYPPATHGGNGRDAYADVEAVRAAPIVGRKALLRETWERYRLPVAITEAHLYSTREEQLRWLAEAFDAAHELAEEGVDMRAVTAWGAFGLYDWDSLVTCQRGHYEAGLFDVRGTEPRPTALARFVATRARGRAFEHPILAVPGWWRREGRIFYDAAPVRFDPVPSDIRPLLIAGRTPLGRALARVCSVRGIPHLLLGRDDLEVADGAAIGATLARHRPWAVVNTVSLADVAQSALDPRRCWERDHLGAVALASACQRAGIRSLTFSSDLVFDGGGARPYTEHDHPRPRSAYGTTMAAAEADILAVAPSALVIRTAAFFSPWEPGNFVNRVVATLAAGEPVGAYEEVTMSPTYVPDLVDAVLDLLIDEEAGIWHVANHGEATWLALAQEAASLAEVDAGRLQGIPAPADLPRYTALTSARAVLLRPWIEALHDWWLRLLPGPDHPLPARRCAAASMR